MISPSTPSDAEKRMHVVSRHYMPTSFIRSLRYYPNIMYRKSSITFFIHIYCVYKTHVSKRGKYFFRNIAFGVFALYVYVRAKNIAFCFGTFSFTYSCPHSQLKLNDMSSWHNIRKYKFQLISNQIKCH